MGKAVVVKGDSVTGTDTHTVLGTLQDPTKVYAGTGAYAYDGAMTKDLSKFVRIGGVPVALVTSGSSLNPGEDVVPTGKHSGPRGSDFDPDAPAPLLTSLSITDTPLGAGTPNSAAGSDLLVINGVKVLLDQDVIDTCSGVPAPGKSKVSAGGQSLVTCSV